MASAAASFQQASFLGGEWSPYAQGRIDQPGYKAALNTCLNAFPIEEASWNRRPGTAEWGITHVNYDGVTREFLLPDGNSAELEFTYGGGTAQLRIWTRPYNGIGNGAVLYTVNHDTIVSISSANPAVLTTTGTPSGWTTGDTIRVDIDPTVSVVNAPTLRNRQFLITVDDTDDFELVDVFTNAPVDGSTLGITGLGTSYASKIKVFSLPYTSLAIVKKIRVVQQDNVMYIYAPGFTTQKLTLTPTLTGLDLTDVSFALTAIDYGTTDGPYLDAASGTSQTGNALAYVVKGADYQHLAFHLVDTGAHTFTAADVGKGIRIWLQPPPYVAGTSYGLGNRVTFNGSMWTAQFPAASLTTAVAPGSSGTTTGGTIVIPWSPEPLAGAWVNGYISAYTSATQVSIVLPSTAPVSGGILFDFTVQINGSFDARNAAYYTDGGATYTSTTGSLIDIWRLGAYGDGVFPTCSCLHEGRIWQGGAIANRFDASQNGNLPGATLVFSPTDLHGAVQDNSGIAETMAGNSQNQLLWMVEDDHGIICGTVGGEYLINASVLTDPLTPTSIQAHRKTRFKSANYEPLKIGHAIIFVQKHRRKVMEYMVDVFSSKYVGRYMNEYAKHLSEAGLNEVAYQEELAPILWTYDDNGALLGCTYRRKSLFSSEPPEFTAWHRHTLGHGRQVRSIAPATGLCDATESLVMLTKDPVSGKCFMEQMSQIFEEDSPLTKAWYVDASPLGGNGVAGTDNPSNSPPAPPPSGAGGKFYFELTVNSGAGGANGYLMFGLANSSASMNKWLGRDSNSGVLGFNGGNMWIAGSAHGTQLTNVNNADVFGVAVDTINNYMWFKNLTRDANWDGGMAGHNPSTGVNGWDISGITGNLYIVVAAPGYASVNSVTLNSGGTAFTGALPTGFVAWDSTAATIWNYWDKGANGQVDGLHTTTQTIGAGSRTAVITTSGPSGVALGGTWNGNSDHSFQNYSAGDTVSFYDMTHAGAVYFATADIGSGTSPPPSLSLWQYNSIGVRTTTSKARV